SVTTSPAPTSKSIPCSTWDSPYQASRPRTARSGAPVPARGSLGRAASAIAASDIGFDHARIGRDGSIVAFGQDLSAREHGDAIRQRGYNGEIVPNHQDGAALADLADQVGGSGDILVAHSSHRLVEQHHLGIKSEGGGNL